MVKFSEMYTFSLEHWPDIKCIPFNHFYMKPWPDLKCLSLFSGTLVISCWSPNKHLSKWQIICRTVHFIQWLNEILQKKIDILFTWKFNFHSHGKRACTEHRSKILFICGSTHIYVHKYLKSSWNQDKKMYCMYLIDLAIVIRLL